MAEHADPYFAELQFSVNIFRGISVYQSVDNGSGKKQLDGKKKACPYYGCP
jgi:hypothetical protein